MRRQVSNDTYHRAESNCSIYNVLRTDGITRAFVMVGASESCTLN